MVHQKHNSDKQDIHQWPLVRAFMHPVVQTIWKALGLQWNSNESAVTDIGSLFIWAEINEETEQFWEHEKQLYNNLINWFINHTKQLGTLPIDRAILKDFTYEFDNAYTVKYHLDNPAIQNIFKKSWFIQFEKSWAINKEQLMQWITIFNSSISLKPSSDYVYKLFLRDNYLTLWTTRDSKHAKYTTKPNFKVRIDKDFVDSVFPEDLLELYTHEYTIYNALQQQITKLEKEREKSAAAQALFRDKTFPITHQKIEEILGQSRIIAIEGIGHIDPSKIEGRLALFNIPEKSEILFSNLHLHRQTYLPPLIRADAKRRRGIEFDDALPGTNTQTIHDQGGDSESIDLYGDLNIDNLYFGNVDLYFDMDNKIWNTERELFIALMNTLQKLDRLWDSNSNHTFSIEEPQIQRLLRQSRYIAPNGPNSIDQSKITSWLNLLSSVDQPYCITFDKKKFSINTQIQYN